MKLTRTFLLAAQLATVAVCQFNMTAPWATTYNFTYLSGADALSYLFDYNPSVPHLADTYWRSWTSGDELPSIDTYRPRYDGNYVNRLCSPRSSSGEAVENFDFSISSCDGMSDEECIEWTKTYEYNLIQARAMYANSPYPCERLAWIVQECGINIVGFVTPNTTQNKGTFAEQNACICKSDYFAAHQACLDCRALHVGNATLEESEERVLSIESSAMCSEAPTATKGLWDYQTSAWKSVYPGHNWSEGFNITIVSDGAQNKTDLSFYMTENVDFVPATIQEPAFTRTVGGTAVAMTPGALKANANANATPAAAAATGAAATGTNDAATGTDAATTVTGAAASAATSEAGAAGMRAPAGAVAAIFGALLMF